MRRADTIRGLALAYGVASAASVYAQGAAVLEQGKTKTLKAQHALVVNPYDTVVSFSVEGGTAAGTVKVNPYGMEEFLCPGCTAVLVTDSGEKVIEVRHQLTEGRRYRLFWSGSRYELREVAAK